MSPLAARDPNRILLAGAEAHALIVDHLPAIESITPGMLVEYHDDSGALKWGVHDSADEPVHRAVAIESIEQNKASIDTAYAADNLMRVAVLSPGAQFLGLIPSGQNITQGARLQSNGDGKLKAAGSGQVAFVAVESPGAVVADTRIRVEVL
jgi:hypothetical protein